MCIKISENQDLNDIFLETTGLIWLLLAIINSQQQRILCFWESCCIGKLLNSGVLS